MVKKAKKRNISNVSQKKLLTFEMQRKQPTKSKEM